MIYDVIIVGSGPSGISCGLYTKRANLSTLIISKKQGSLKKAEKIENYYGLASALSGHELLQIGETQAKDLGIEIVDDEVISISFENNFLLKTKTQNFEAKSVYLSTGKTSEKPKIKNLENLEGSGISYCAICDAFFYRKKDVAVIGNADYALFEAEELRHLASNVSILTNGLDFIGNNTDLKIDNRKIKEILGKENVEGVMFEDGDTLNLNGIFIALGSADSIDFARKIGAETRNNKIVVDKNMMTNINGLFAGGDCTEGIMQIAKAVSDGCLAGMSIIKFVRKISS